MTCHVHLQCLGDPPWRMRHLHFRSSLVPRKSSVGPCQSSSVLGWSSRLLILEASRPTQWPSPHAACDLGATRGPTFLFEGAHQSAGGHPFHYVKTSNKSHNIYNGSLTRVTWTHICNSCCFAPVTHKSGRPTLGFATTTHLLPMRTSGNGLVNTRYINYL
jgi:hypothetical protein